MTSDGRTGKHRALRYSLLVLAVVLFILGGLGLVFRSYLAAQARAVAVLAVVLEVPVLEGAVGLATGEPRLEESVVAGAPTTIAYPAGEGPSPALVFLNGATSLGRENPHVERLVEGFSRAGYVVYVPDPPGLMEGEISGRTAASATAVIREAHEDPETREGGVVLVGASVGASLALLAAAEPDLREEVSLVAGIAPYADLREVIRLGTTGAYRQSAAPEPGEPTGEPAGFEPDPFLGLVVARSLAAGLPSQEGEELRRALQGLPETAADPLAAFRVCSRYADELATLFAHRPAPGDEDPSSLLRACAAPESGVARDVVRVLGNTEPAAFDALYAELPQEQRAEFERLSPVFEAGEIAAPVRLVSAPQDRYFPVEEFRAVEQRVPDAEVVLTPALSHADPDPGDLRDFAELNGFVVEALREAAS